MQNDTNTTGYNQWFYFSFKNGNNPKVKFNIVNFIKKKLMFLDGVKPVGFSLLSHEKNGKGWHSIGSNVEYKKSYINRETQGGVKNYYSLSFEVEFPHLNDTYYFALNYPYTYTTMINFVNRFMTCVPPEM